MSRKLMLLTGFFFLVSIAIAYGIDVIMLGRTNGAVEQNNNITFIMAQRGEIPSSGICASAQLLIRGSDSNSSFISSNMSCDGEAAGNKNHQSALFMERTLLNFTMNMTFALNASMAVIRCADATDTCDLVVYHGIYNSSTDYISADPSPSPVMFRSQSRHNFTNWEFLFNWTMINSSTGNLTLIINRTQSISSLATAPLDQFKFMATYRNANQQPFIIQLNVTNIIQDAIFFKNLTILLNRFGLPINLTQEAIITNYNATFLSVNFTVMMPNGTTVLAGNGTFVLNSVAADANFWSNWTPPSSFIIPNRTSSIGNWTINITTETRKTYPNPVYSFNLSYLDSDPPRINMSSPNNGTMSSTTVSYNVSFIDNLVTSEEVFANDLCFYNVTVQSSGAIDVATTYSSCSTFSGTFGVSGGNNQYSFNVCANDTSSNLQCDQRIFVVSVAGGGNGGGGGGGGGATTTPQGIICDTATSKWNATTEQNSNRLVFNIAPRDTRDQVVKITNYGIDPVTLSLACQSVTPNSCSFVNLKRNNVTLLPSRLVPERIAFNITAPSEIRNINQTMYFNLLVSDDKACSGILNIEAKITLLGGLIFKLNKPISFFNVFSLPVGIILLFIAPVIALMTVIFFRLFFKESPRRKQLTTISSFALSTLVIFVVLIIA